MSLLPINPGDKVRWNGKSVSVVAINLESAAVKGEDGVTRIVNLKALYACQPRAVRPKGGVLA